MAYEKEFLANKDKKKFINVCKKKYKKTKEGTFLRAWYSLRKKNIEPVKKESLSEYIYVDKKPKKQKVKYPPSMKREPNMFKKMEITDMKKLNYKLTRKFLKRYNFDEYEINWLEDNGYLK